MKSLSTIYVITSNRWDVSDTTGWMMGFDTDFVFLYLTDTKNPLNWLFDYYGLINCEAFIHVHVDHL